MATNDGGFNGGKPFILRLEMNERSTDINNNSSVVNVLLSIIKTGTSPSWSNGTSTWSLQINGTQYSGSFTYDFRNSDSLLLFATDATIPHDPDGRKVLGGSGSANANGLGSASVSILMDLTTIARATQPTLPTGNTVETGQILNIGLPRASSGFTSTIRLDIGGKSYPIADKYNGDSYGWTVPIEVANAMPNNTKLNGNIVVYTFNGNTQIGDFKLVVCYVVLSGNIVPSFGTVTSSEANAVVTNSGVGAYIQGLTKLALALTSPAGVYSSTITGYKLTVADQVINAQTGTTNVITGSGTVAITGTVTDSRGRSTSKTVNITVLPYSPPQLNTVTVQRALASAVVNDQGTFAKVGLAVAVTSLKPGSTEKNTLTYSISSRQRNVGSFATKNTASPSGTSFSSSVLLSTYSIELSWEFLIQVTDKFSTSSVVLTMTAAAIFMHWDSTAGVGIGKFREQGSLDVIGDIYHRNGGIVQPVGMITPYAGSTSPAGWLICNGGLISRTTYAALFALIGTTYGAGDGSTTFGLPNLKGRTIVGVDSTQTEFDNIGETGGEKAHVLSTAEMPSHSHGLQQPPSGIAQSGSQIAAEFVVTQGSGGFANKFTNNNGSGAAHNNLQPYMALNYLIKV